MTTTSIDPSLNSRRLAIILYRRKHFGPADDVYMENPVGVFRGLTFVLVLNVLLGLTGMAIWGIWQMLK